jgi:hypothetical protein
VVRACKAKFDEQLCRVYTRAVYQEYKKNTITAPRLSSDQIQTQKCEMGGWSSMNKVEGSFAGCNMNSKSWRIKRTVNTDAKANSGNTQV